MDNTQRPGTSPPSEGELLGRVRQAWAEVLDLDSAETVPLDANFLEVGGSSLLLIMLWEELHELTPHELKVSDLFQHGTVRSQAALLAGGADRGVTEFGARDRHQLLGRARRHDPVPAVGAGE